MRATHLATLLCLLVLPAHAQREPTALRWRAPDATGLAAWRALLAETADLAADARAARFRPARGLREITADLDGDGRAEVLLHVDLPGWCGSAGCTVFVMRRDETGAWRELCVTNAHRDRPVRLAPPDASGRRAFAASARVSLETDAAGRLTCREDPLPRSG